jgi:hypothetical protein
MFRLIRLLFWVAALAALWWFSVTVPLGKFTLWEHMKRIWHSSETQDLVNGAEDATKPAVDKGKRAVKAGVDEAKRNP